MDEFGFISVPEFLMPYIEDWVQGFEPFGFWVSLDRLYKAERLSDEFVEFDVAKLRLGLGDQKWWLN